MKTMSIRDFMVENDFCQVNKSVAENSNGYKFLTFINSGNEAENVYFTKSLNEEVLVGTPVNKDFVKDKVICIVENAKGEIRYKIASKGESLRVNIEDLFD